jgi:hypothetical protein
MREILLITSETKERIELVPIIFYIIFAFCLCNNLYHIILILTDKRWCKHEEVDAPCNYNGFDIDGLRDWSSIETSSKTKNA